LEPFLSLILTLIFPAKQDAHIGDELLQERGWIKRGFYDVENVSPSLNDLEEGVNH
jgi:hypothetical protein